jgi:hypothetical protein
LSLKYRDCDGVRQVQAALAFAHGQLETAFIGKAVAQFGRQAPGFCAENKPISRLKSHLMQAPRAACGHGEKAFRIGLLVF